MYVGSESDEIRVPESLRADVKRFGSSMPPESAFRVAARQGDIGKYLAGEIDLPTLVEKLDDYAEILDQGRPSGAATAQSETDDHRGRALMEILADDANRDSSVVEFRDTHLGDGLLPHDGVADWMASTGSSDGEPTRWITTPDTGDKNQEEAHRTEAEESVRFTVADARHNRSAPIRLGGVLDELKAVARTVTKLTAWSESQATTFVLTGLRPQSCRIRWQVLNPRPFILGQQPIIRIEATPDVPLAEVDQVFRRERRRLLNEKGTPRVLRRALSEKHAELAIHASRHRRGHTWIESQRIWDEANPNIAYGDKNPQFIRDSRDAYQRVTGVPLEWRGKPRGGRSL